MSHIPTTSFKEHRNDTGKNDAESRHQSTAKDGQESEQAIPDGLLSRQLPVSSFLVVIPELRSKGAPPVPGNLENAVCQVC